MATVLPPNTTHMFSSLTPFTQYMVTIAAVDPMDRQGESSTITVTTNIAGIDPKLHKVVLLVILLYDDNFL